MKAVCLLRVAVWGLLAMVLCQCKSRVRQQVYISVPEQRLGLYNSEGDLMKLFPVSTSKFGVGDVRGSNCTPLGKLMVQEKIGQSMPSGMVFKGRRPTGEIIPPNAPGRDPVLTRILWLRGLELGNRNAYVRYIYIHGTPEERYIGYPASYGCVRMKSHDVIQLYNLVNVGTQVTVTMGKLPKRTDSLLPRRKRR